MAKGLRSGSNDGAGDAGDSRVDDGDFISPLDLTTGRTIKAGDEIGPAGEAGDDAGQAQPSEGIRVTTSAEPPTGQPEQPRAKRKYTRRAASSASDEEAVSRGIRATAIEKVFATFHFMLATATGVPEFKLASEEAKDIADALQPVTRQYTKLLSPESAAMLDAATIIGGIYAAHVGYFVARKIHESKAPRQYRAAPQQPAPEPQPPPDVDEAQQFEPVQLAG